MPNILTDALVIRRADYAEYDRMVTLFTPGNGRMDAVIRGCKRPKSPLINASEPFCAGEFELYEARNRLTVKQVNITESFYDLRTDYEKLVHGMYYLHLIDYAVMPGIPAAQLFLKTLRALAFLSYSDLPPELVTMAFEMHFMSEIGLRPQMRYCVNCGAEITTDAHFDTVRGGAVCLQCASSAPVISNGARRIMMKLPATKFDSVSLLPDRPEWPEAARLFRQYVLAKIRKPAKQMPGVYGGDGRNGSPRFS